MIKFKGADKMGKNKKVDVTLLKLANYQTEALNIVAQFRSHLQRHFEIVEIKTKKLIDERWSNKEV